MDTCIFVVIYFHCQQNWTVQGQSIVCLHGHGQFIFVNFSVLRVLKINHTQKQIGLQYLRDIPAPAVNC